MSGIDTSKFTAYSTRYAATSAAQKLGINIDQIRKTAVAARALVPFPNSITGPNMDNFNDCFGRATMNSIRK